MYQEVHKRLRDDFTKDKIKRQLKKLMNHTEQTANNHRRDLPQIIIEKHSNIVDTYESLEKQPTQHNKDIMKLYSAE